MNIIGKYIKVDGENRQIELAYGHTILVKKYEQIKENSPNLILVSNGINIGSLWKKTSKNGNQYLSGNLLLPNFSKVFINVLFGLIALEVHRNNFSLFIEICNNTDFEFVKIASASFQNHMKRLKNNRIY